MSEPLPIAQTFIMNDFESRVKLDSIVCLVDAINFRSNFMKDIATTFEQIEYANFVILNKVDGVKEEELDAIKKTIKELNKYCVIVETNYCDVDLNYILDTTNFEVTETLEEKMKHHHHHHHHNGIGEYLFKTEETCYTLENMKHFLADLGDDIFRVKGFVHFREQPEKRYIIQKAGSCFTLSIDEAWNGTDMVSKIVFIGKNIDTQKLQDTLLNEVFFTL